MNVIEIKNLSFSYEKDIILENVNLHVKEKEFLAIIGPNGGGKSTLLKLIIALEKPKIPSIKIFGENPSKNLTSIGYVPQNTNVNTNFPIKVIEVVMMGHVGHKKPLIGYKKEEINCALGVLEQVGMKEFAQNKIGSLSGGQRQRVMIARALCSHPKILLLDEPTSNIDIKGQKEIYNLLKELNKYITIVVVSHDISIILEYASSVAHVNKNLAFHDVSKKRKFHANDGHFCEVELLQMLGEKHV
ncbi:metal ABC transporter ATP-binding protein [Sulfurospirillum arcachonense]|uniref:metal ABC transporter ATP-binding protein n=1 Tax=Sulfurospirillum arcachonense TaxID=57666 RepID=UPI00046A08AB|nr:ABC transporter ATP-binding protein [Sulfurospirillum arcachonense]